MLQKYKTRAFGCHESSKDALYWNICFRFQALTFVRMGFMSHSYFRAGEKSTRKRIQFFLLTYAHILKTFPAHAMSLSCGLQHQYSCWMSRTYLRHWPCPKSVGLLENQPQKSSFKCINGSGGLHVSIDEWADMGHALGHLDSATACHWARPSKTLRSSIRVTATHSGKVYNSKGGRGP